MKVYFTVYRPCFHIFCPVMYPGADPGVCESVLGKSYVQAIEYGYQENMGNKSAAQCDRHHGYPDHFYGFIEELQQATAATDLPGQSASSAAVT